MNLESEILNKTYKRFEEIEAWQKARELAQQVYRLSSEGSFAKDFKLRSMINELYLEGKLQHFSVVFNDIELIRRRKSIYGGYGYGYYEEDKGKNGKT